MAILIKLVVYFHVKAKIMKKMGKKCLKCGFYKEYDLGELFVYPLTVLEKFT